MQSPNDDHNLVTVAGLDYAAIEDSEYEIHWHQEVGAFLTPNRAHNLTFIIYDDGFGLTPRELKAGERSWCATMRLDSYGKVGSRGRPLGPVSWKPNGGKVTSEGATISVDYSNDKHGLRQNFLLKKRPAGKGPVRLEFRLILENVEIDVDTPGECLYFVGGESETRVAARYWGLKVFDASSRRLEAGMTQVTEDRFAIVIDDEGAQYPLLVDPLADDGYLYSPSEGSSFGYSSASNPRYCPGGRTPGRPVRARGRQWLRSE